MQLAGLIGTFVAPVMYGWISGYVLAVGGVVVIAGLAAAAPVLRREWRRVSAAGPAPYGDELAARDGAQPTAAAQPPSGIE